MHRILILIAALSVVLAACVHAVPAGRSIALTGTVMVKGSALFQQPVLVTADGEAMGSRKIPRGTGPGPGQPAGDSNRRGAARKPARHLGAGHSRRTCGRRAGRAFAVDGRRRAARS
ncbi:hypothetical protein ACU4GD_42560 [Cupriavidus basilensis]